MCLMCNIKFNPCSYQTPLTHPAEEKLTHKGGTLNSVGALHLEITIFHL